MTQRQSLEELAHCLPRPVARTLLQLPEGSVQEIRIRVGEKTVIRTLEESKTCGLEPTPQQVGQMAEALCEHALYARVEEQRSGFVTLRGGHRMGLCGRVLLQGQSVRALREISSLCIRIAGQWRGAADRLLPLLTDETGRVMSTLIVGMPGSGKTTMLRDACLRLSERGFRMGVVDERSEIAAMSSGEAQLAVGPNTDVLDGCCKEAGLRWMLRSMLPQERSTTPCCTSAMRMLLSVLSKPSSSTRPVEAPPAAYEDLQLSVLPLQLEKVVCSFWIPLLHYF